MQRILYDYLTAHTGTLTLSDIVLNFTVALILGMVIFLAYRFSFSGNVYSARFNVSLVMLAIVTAMAMSVIGNNIALSLGMVGALSIVRFRTAIKDPRDTTYIFWAIIVGICCGVGEYMIAGVGTAVVFLFMLFFGSIRRNDHFLFIVRGKREVSEKIEDMTRQYFDNNAKVKVVNSSSEDVEYIFSLTEMHVKTAKEKNSTIPADYFLKTEGIFAVNLVSQNDEINR